MVSGLLAMSTAVPVVAQHGGGMGFGGPQMSGSGMMIVADDGSLLVTNMDSSSMMDGGPGSPGMVSRELVNIGADGSERWRVDFTEGWPMMPVTDGNLVVVVLVDTWFIGSGMGDGGFGGGMMGGKVLGAKDGGNPATVVALDLTTGNEAWRLALDGDMASMPLFAPDGSQFYLTLRNMDGDHVGGGSLRQGDAAGAGILMSTTLVAIDRGGAQLWSLDLSIDGGKGGPMAGGGS